MMSMVRLAFSWNWFVLKAHMWGCSVYYWALCQLSTFLQLDVDSYSLLLCTVCLNWWTTLLLLNLVVNKVNVSLSVHGIPRAVAFTSFELLFWRLLLDRLRRWLSHTECRLCQPMTIGWPHFQQQFRNSGSMNGTGVGVENVCQIQGFRWYELLLAALWAKKTQNQNKG